MAYSILFSKSDSREYTSEDIKNMLNSEVSFVGRDLYRKVIVALSTGKSYNEIIHMIDNYDGLEYENLLEDQKSYVKAKVKKDLYNRELKLKER